MSDQSEVTPMTSAAPFPDYGSGEQTTPDKPESMQWAPGFDIGDEPASAACWPADGDDGMGCLDKSDGHVCALWHYHRGESHRCVHGRTWNGDQPEAPLPAPDENLIGLIEKPRAKAKGHKELIHDDGTTQVYRWVPDEE